jgi:lysophospholipase L1-like esterase
MKRFGCRWFAAVTLAWACAAGAADNPGASFFFRDGDRVVMMGDSITEQYLYSTYVELWTLTRFPSWNITFRNVGIGGDRSPGGNSRFTRDAVPLRPTAMTVDFGMNDGGYGGFNEGAFRTYTNGLQGIADQARSNQVRVAWVTPQPVEKNEDGPAIEGYAATLEKFSDGVKTVAEANHGLFVDQFHPYLQAMEKARASDPKRRIMGGDRVHPGPPGQALMAASILQAMNFPPLVSAVEVDAAQMKVVKASQCQVTDLATGTNGVLRFQQLDAAIPFFPAGAESILSWAHILQDLNVYELKVTGLKPGSYEIRLGGKTVTNATDTMLAQGVNLAEAALKEGPVAAQVKAVVAAVEAKNRFFHEKIFRGVTLATYSIPDFVTNKKDLETQIEAQRASTFAQRLAEMTKYDETIRKALVIQPHQVELVWMGPTARKP